MNRRRALQLFASSNALLIAGCTSLGEQPGPFNFAIVNLRERSYAAEFTVRKGADTILLDGDVDIAASPPGDGEKAVLHFDELTQVTNGDVITVRIQIDGETYEETYEVTCNQSETAQNNFFFRIRHPEAPTSSETGMEFAGSEC
jgi:hypothetical protein